MAQGVRFSASTGPLLGLGLSNGVMDPAAGILPYLAPQQDTKVSWFPAGAIFTHSLTGSKAPMADGR